MKKAALIFVPILLILIIAGFFFTKNRPSQKEEVTVTPTPASGTKFSLPENKQSFSSNKQEGIEVDLTPRYDKKAVILKIAKLPTDVISVEYEFSYEAKGGLPKGVLGKIEVKSGQETILREILLGTCSRNVCVYDEGVKKVSLVLKFNKSSGQSTGFAKDYEF